MFCGRRMKFFTRLSQTIVALALINILTSNAVNLNRYNKLKREEFTQLDREVTRFYNDTYESLDDRNITYDEQLLNSIKALRHTIVLNQIDYKYTSDEIMRNSAGKNVNQELCQQQLKALVNMVRHSNRIRELGSEDPTPLSILDFLESGGRSESGVLNGNFVWYGSFPSCNRAFIPAKQVHNYLASKQYRDLSIKGRYCIAHIRSKSWPKWDTYFEDRLNIRVGICLPDTCHSINFVNSSEIREDVDLLTRVNLAFPFNTERYETSYLYCLPDEDSPFRQLDTGSKLFIAFLAIWASIIIYTNVKYYKRMKAMRKLRTSVDIKMIVNERRESDDELEQRDYVSKSAFQLNEKATEETIPSSPSVQMLRLPESQGKLSANSSPIPSDIEENDGEFNAIRTIVVPEKRRGKRRSLVYEYESTGQEIDFVRAFSIKSNLDFLLKTRTNEIQAKNRETRSGSQQVDSNTRKLLTQVNRRTSSSNEALIKSLQREDGNSKQVSIVSSNSSEASNINSDGREKKRVVIDIFDGIKVISTFYIIYGHTMMFFFGLVSDLRFGKERMLELTMIATLNTLQVVGLFYIITGTLLTYLAFSRTKVKQLLRPSFWFLIMFNRYVRLIPVYFLIFWFARHVSPYTGQGVLWFDYRTDAEHSRGFCATESWTTMLTMSAANNKIPYGCIPQAWYLSNDFRTLLLLPFYIIILAMNHIAGYVMILATFVFSSIRLVYILREANIDYKVILQWTPHVYSIMADRLHDVYTDLAVRLSTYLLGVVVGHLLYLYETRQIKQWPRWFRAFGMKLGLIMGAVFFMGAPLMSSPLINQFLPDHKDIDSESVLVLIPIFKNSMEICICFVLLRLATGGGYSWLRDLLSGKPAKVLSNISYAVFLVHVEVMYKVPSIKFESSYWYLYLYSTFFIVLSNAVAFFIYIFYEMPINNLIRYATRRVFNRITN